MGCPLHPRDDAYGCEHCNALYRLERPLLPPLEPAVSTAREVYRLVDSLKAALAAGHAREARLREALLDVIAEAHDCFCCADDACPTCERARAALAEEGPTTTMATRRRAEEPQVCPECDGEGKWFDGSHGCTRTCQTCKGKGCFAAPAEEGQP